MMKFSKLDQLRQKLRLKVARSQSKSKVSSSYSKSKVSRSHSKLKRPSGSATTTAKRIPKLFSCASPMKLTKLYRFITKEQKDMINKSDFYGLLEIKCSKLCPDLCKFLMESFDPSTCAMVFPGRGTIPITKDDVHNVLRIPRGSEEVKYEIDHAAVSYMMAEFGLEGTKQPTLGYLETLLVNMKQANNTYLRLWVVYAVSSVLAPTTGTTLSPRCYPSLVHLDPEKSKGLNFCKFVIEILCSTAKEKGKNIFKACMLFMMIKYLDSLEVPDLEVCPDGSRVSAWSNEMVNKVTDADKIDDGLFGNLQAISRYTEAIGEACADFEVLLQRFIRKASGKDDIGGSSKERKRKTGKPRKDRHTKKRRETNTEDVEENVNLLEVTVHLSPAAEDNTDVYPSPPAENNTDGSDADFKCSSNEADDSSEDVSFDAEPLDVLYDEKAEDTEDSDFMQTEKEERPIGITKGMSRQKKQAGNKGVKSRTEGIVFIEDTKIEKPARRTIDVFGGEQARNQDIIVEKTPNEIVAKRSSKQFREQEDAAKEARTNTGKSVDVLAAICTIYDSDSDSLNRVQEVKDSERLRQSSTWSMRCASAKSITLLDMDSSKSTSSIMDALLTLKFSNEKEASAQAETKKEVVPKSTSCNKAKSVSFADTNGENVDPHWDVTPAVGHGIIPTDVEATIGVKQPQWDATPAEADADSPEKQPQWDVTPATTGVISASIDHANISDRQPLWDVTPLTTVEPEKVQIRSILKTTTKVTNMSSTHEQIDEKLGQTQGAECVW